LRLFAEQRADLDFLTAIYSEEIAGGQIAPDAGLSPSGAVGGAEFSLLEHPNTPVALVLTTQTEDLRECRKILGLAEGMLASAYPHNWHVALAIPRLDAWAVQDPVVQAAFAANPRTQPGVPDSYQNRARLLQELVQRRPFDREALRQASTQFAALDAFIQEQLKAAAQPRRALAF